MKYRVRGNLDQPTYPKQPSSALLPIRKEPISVDELYGQYQLSEFSPQQLEQVTNSRRRRMRRN